MDFNAGNVILLSLVHPLKALVLISVAMENEAVVRLLRPINILFGTSLINGNDTTARLVQPLKIKWGKRPMLLTIGKMALVNLLQFVNADSFNPVNNGNEIVERL